MKTTPKPLLVLPVEAKTTAAQIKKLEASGYAVIQVPEPERVKVLLPADSVMGGDLLMSAVHGIVQAHGGLAKQYMVDELYRRLSHREQHPTS